MIKDLQYISVVEKLSQKGFAFHKRLLLLYANRLSYFSQVPAEAFTEDFDASKALTLGLKQKAFVRIENIISIAPVEDQVLKKKKKRHMFTIQFVKEAMNNFSQCSVEYNPKNKPISWTFAVQQTEEYKKWLEILALAKSRVRDLDSKENIYMGMENPTMFRQDKQALVINELDMNEKDYSSSEQVTSKVTSKTSLDKEKRPSNFDESNIPDLQPEKEGPKEMPLAEIGKRKPRLSMADKQAVDEAAQKLMSVFAGKKKTHDAKVQKEILRKKVEEEVKVAKEPEISEKNYRKAIMNEVFKGSWEAKFNSLLDKHLKCLDNFDDLLDSEFKLLKFVKDFCARAVDTCRSIIDELPRPPQERTHKAIQITMLENDQEIPELVFMLNNCIIRITWTVGGLEEISEAGEYYLYSEKVVKSYGNEFRAMNLLNDCTYLVNRKYKNVIFRVPLSMVVDYKGFRCIVISSPPINGDETLVVGPSVNEGSYKVNKFIEEDLKTIAQNMNLKEHKFSLEDKGTTLDVSLSVLVEVHKTNIDLAEVENSNDANTSCISYENDKSTTDKKELDCYYLMNTSEIIPVDIDIDATAPASFLKRLRPEYVTSCDIPLSADAFINQSQIVDAQKDDFEVIQAGKALQQELIPKFIEKLESLDILPFHSASLTNAFHINGINMRYLGAICKKTALPHIKGLCVQEMISRSAKKILRKQLSELTIKEIRQENSAGSGLINQSIDDIPLTKQVSYARKLDGIRLEALVDFLNLLFGTGKESETFWWGVLSKQVLYDYGYQLKKTVKNELFYGGLLGAISYHCNFKIALDEELEKSLGKTLNPFKKDHIKGFTVKPKMYRLEKLDIRKLEDKCKDALDSKHYELAIKLCELLISSERVLNLEGKSANELNYLEHLADIYLEVKDLEKAYEIAKETLHEFNDKEIDAVKFLIIVMKIHMMRNDSQLVEEIFYEIIACLDHNLGNYHPLHSSIYNMVGYYYVEKGQYNDALVLYRSSLVCLKKILGEDHASTAEILAELGNLLVKMNKNEEALEYYNKALNVYLKKKEQDSLATANICMQMAKILFTLGSLRDTMSVVDKALDYFEKDEEDYYESIVQCSVIAMQVSEIVYDWEKALDLAGKIWSILVQYEIEDFQGILDKIVRTTMKAFIHTQSSDIKKTLISAFEALDRTLVQTGELTEGVMANGDEGLKRALYAELIEEGKKGLELQNWFGLTFEYLLGFLRSTPVEAFFNENYRQNIVEEGNEEIEDSLRNFERLTRSLGTDFIYETFVVMQNRS